MRLAFGFGNMHQIAIGQPCLPQHGAGNFDVVIFGERADDTGRRIGNWRNAAREFGERLGFNLLDQASDDIIEKRDVRGIETRDAIEE